MLIYASNKFMSNNDFNFANLCVTSLIIFSQHSNDIRKKFKKAYDMDRIAHIINFI